MSALAPVKDIIADIKAGRMVILVDEEDRENEGDVVLAAEFVTPEAINFMVKHCRGLVCLTLTEERCAQLGLKQMVRDNRTPHGTAFTASIEAATGVTTGISAHDRARTIQVAVARNAKPEDIVMPGHIFPLQAQKGGVLIRAGHTEAGCDLAQLAGLEPAGVICEILKDDGTMARLPDLIEFAAEHGLKIGAKRCVHSNIKVIAKNSHSRCISLSRVSKSIYINLFPVTAVFTAIYFTAIPIPY